MSEMERDVKNSVTDYSTEIDCNSCQREQEINRLKVCLSLADVAVKSMESEIDSLKYSLTHDETTGIRNLRCLNEVLEKEPLDRFYEHIDSNNYSCVFFNMDINYFKTVNDQIGHSQGDDVLRCVANYIEGCFRKSDTVVRMHGDEFAAFIKVNKYSENGDENDTNKVAETIKNKLSGLRSDDEDMQEIIDGYNLGIATGYVVIDENSRYKDYGEIMELADQRMYMDKADNKR